jgi:beta-galactosidase
MSGIIDRIFPSILNMRAAHTTEAAPSKAAFHPAEHEDPTPWKGAIKPRSWNVQSDSARHSLNGKWKFRFSPTAAVAEDFARPQGVDDSDWELMPVPAHWCLHGHGQPAYQNVQFPFPVDPPFVPDENPTGDYRLKFDLPKDWSKDGKVSTLYLRVQQDTPR